MNAATKIQLQGRIFLTFDIRAVTGLHIGGAFEGISIGGVDKTIIRDPLTDQPYIPGSSLRGKMRSLTEKFLGLQQNQRVGQTRIHSCGAGDTVEDAAKAYLSCSVCQVYGVPGEREFATPTRLIVRDVPLTPKSVTELQGKRTDLPFSEVKTEVSIDRVTSAANPRQMERVPAGVAFGPAEFVYSVYEGTGCNTKRDIKNFRTVVTGLQLLADDYLGGLGSRGSGRVEFQNLQIDVRSRQNYHERRTVESYKTLNELIAGLDALVQRIEGTFLRAEEADDAETHCC